MSPTLMRQSRRSSDGSVQRIMLPKRPLHPYNRSMSTLSAGDHANVRHGFTAGRSISPISPLALGSNESRRTRYPLRLPSAQSEADLLSPSTGGRRRRLSSDARTTTELGFLRSGSSEEECLSSSSLSPHSPEGDSQVIFQLFCFVYCSCISMSALTFVTIVRADIYSSVERNIAFYFVCVLTPVAFIQPCVFKLQSSTGQSKRQSNESYEKVIASRSVELTIEKVFALTMRILGVRSTGNVSRRCRSVMSVLS